MRKHSIEQQDSQEQTADGLASEGMRMLNILNCEASAGFQTRCHIQSYLWMSFAAVARSGTYGPYHNYYASFQEKLDHL